MSWTQVVKDWNKTKVIKDDSGVYALPIRGGDDYKDVRRIYDKIKKKQAEKEIEADKKLQKKIEVKKQVVEVKKAEELTKRREKAAEGLKKVAEETAERNKQRKREAEERKMMAGEEVLSREKRSEKLEKKEAKGTITKMEAATLFEDKYVEGYEFKNRKDMAIAVRAFRIALPELTSSVDALAKFFMKRGFKGSEYEMAFRKGAARPGKTFVQDALNNRV